LLAGTFRFTGPGTWVIVPTGAPHTFANVGDENAVMLNTFTPDLYVQYFRDFKAMIDSGQPVNADYTVVGGKFVVKEGELCTVDERTLIEKHNQAAKRLLSR